MKRVVPSLLGILVLLLAACSAGGSPPSGSPDADDGDGGAGVIETPTGEGDAILTVESRGGFVPVQFVATQTPSFVMLGDGRVIMLGAQTLEFPGPALPPLVERRLTPDGVQRVVAAIVETNLFGSDLDLRGAQNMVADASDTVFTLNAGGTTTTVSVYGLGTLTPIPGQENQAPPGVSDAEIQAHGTLQRLNDQLMMLDTWVEDELWADDGWQPYEPEALRLYVRDVTDQPVEGGDIPQQVREWPTEADPRSAGDEQELFGDGTRCVAVDGDEAETWLAELSQANQMTLWVPDDDPDARFAVTPRPVLPHEDAACPELTGGA